MLITFAVVLMPKQIEFAGDLTDGETSPEPKPKESAIDYPTPLPVVEGKERILSAITYNYFVICDYIPEVVVKDASLSEKNVYLAESPISPFEMGINLFCLF